VCCLLQIAVTPISVVNKIFIKRKWKLNTIYRFNQNTHVHFPTEKQYLELFGLNFVHGYLDLVFIWSGFLVAALILSQSGPWWSRFVAYHTCLCCLRGLLGGSLRQRHVYVTESRQARAIGLTLSREEARRNHARRLGTAALHVDGIKEEMYGLNVTPNRIWSNMSPSKLRLISSKLRLISSRWSGWTKI
jgi:hypothetical protein